MRSEHQKPTQKQIRKIRQLLFNSQQQTAHTNYAFHFLFLCGKENRKIISNFILNEKAFGNSNNNNNKTPRKARKLCTFAYYERHEK